MNRTKEKRERTLQAAARELARVPINPRAINKIVADADISRGSFYQYFSDKEDMLIYLMTDLRQSVEKHLEATLINNGGDLLNAVGEILRFTVDMGLKLTMGETYKNVFANINLCVFDAIAIIGPEFAKNIIQNAAKYGDATNYAALDPNALKDAIEMVVDLLYCAIARTFANPSNREAVQRRFENISRIISRSMNEGELDV